MIYLHHHLGLGDHIICNGLVRSLLDTHADGLVLFTKETNLPRVRRMYEDERRIRLEGVPPDQVDSVFVDRFMAGRPERLLRVGFDQLWRYAPLNFDQVFYIGAGVPFSNRWDRFKINRHTEDEAAVVARLNPSGEPFMFVHDDPSRGYSFDPPNPRGLKVIRNDMGVCIFDMMGLLEQAAEIHCMESSFRCLIEVMPNVTCPLFLHKQVRFAGQANPALSLARKPWVEV